MKFFTEEITTMKDGSVAYALTEKTTENDAISGFHSAMASATINPDVASIHVEAKNSVGGIYESKTWIAEAVTE